ncbi:MAG TPA: TetR/AcrR family transcriptional regulator [Ktedonobacterales bacterium]|nr:TetR/AcrR family transcriptional regulator [Ktedonobacterales bacterium]
MPGDVRERMIDGAVRLLAQRGLQATSFAEVLALTGTPRGSVYHHFPGGKDQLVGAALDRASARALRALGEHEDASAEELTSVFLGIWRELLLRSHYGAGCAVLAVTVATDSNDLLRHAGAIFRTWRGELAERFERAGLAARAATQFAATLVAASEGAVVLSRAEQSLEPFELVADQLLEQVRSLARG